MITMISEIKTSIFGKMFFIALIMSFTASSIPSGWAEQALLPIDQQEAPVVPANESTTDSSTGTESEAIPDEAQPLIAADDSPLSAPVPEEPKSDEIPSQNIEVPSQVFLLNNGHKFVYNDENHSGVDIAPDGTQTSYEDVRLFLNGETVCSGSGSEMICSAGAYSMPELSNGEVLIGQYNIDEVLPNEVTRSRTFSIIGVPTIVKAMIVQVKNDLVTNYGLSAEALDAYIKSGQIVIKVDPEHLTTHVFIGEGVTLPADAILYIDPLGERKLPGVIMYQLKEGLQMGAPCQANADGIVSCPPPNFVIDSARAVVGDYLYEISYGAGYYPTGRISFVNVYQRNSSDPLKHDQMFCPEEGCLGTLVKKINYYWSSYWSDNTSITAYISYVNPQDGITNRVVHIGYSWQEGDAVTAFADGKNRILYVYDVDVFGNKVLNKFKYMGYVSAHALSMVSCSDVEGGVCTVPPATFGYVLWQIDRFDDEGNALSHINFQLPGTASVFIEGLQEKFEVQYSDFEDLLAQVKKLEAQNRLRAVTELLKNDLMKNFGFDEGVLDALIKKGLIKFKIETWGPMLDLTNVHVVIDPSVQLPNVVFLPDPLGSQKLPGLIHYVVRTTFPTVVCAGEGICNPEPVYSLESADFQLGDNYYQLGYFPNTGNISNNLLHTVKIYRGDPNLVCITAPCPTGQLIKDIRYIYTAMARRMLAGGNVTGSAPIFAIVRYPNAGGDEITNRIIKFDLRTEDGLNFADKKHRIVQVIDRDSAGNKVVNKFKYLGLKNETDPLCPSGANCSPYGQFAYQLWQIERLNALGKALSRIFLWGAQKALVILEPDQKEVEVQFFNFEDLLAQVLRLEINLNEGPEYPLPVPTAIKPLVAH